MKNTLEKILSGHGLQNSQPVPVVATAVAPTTKDEPPEKKSDFAPCPTCHCRVFWADPSNSTHCCQCSPPPHESMARAWFVLVAEPTLSAGGGPVGVTYWPLKIDWNALGVTRESVMSGPFEIPDAGEGENGDGYRDGEGPDGEGPGVPAAAWRSGSVWVEESRPDGGSRLVRLDVPGARAPGVW